MMKAIVISWGVLILTPCVLSWTSSNPGRQAFTSLHAKPQTAETQMDASAIFFDFVDFLKKTQREIIEKIEKMDGSGVSFTNDTWGVFEGGDEKLLSGGITRVFQGGNVIEKGACSLTLIRQGILTAERAAAIRSRQDLDITAGDIYSAAALSIVLHSRSPRVPTFRSDVRVFFVQSDTDTMAWFGGGADLTPYYLFDEDATFFHNMYRDLCDDNPKEFSYQNLKELCDNYFYLPARAEHRGTGGIFFDDMEATPENYDFVKDVANAWMPSWLPIVERRRNTPFTEKQKQWQLLRRGRYLEFNLLYDRGVKFGLANTNPRVEGVMVSAPPLVSRNFLILLLLICIVDLLVRSYFSSRLPGSTTTKSKKAARKPGS
jgi:coproporphyrinogen III oxidase